ncbi:MAG: signal peptidase II [Clostridiales bacterium]|jgi:signal peptidase II|nr:signal peptidase II [Clostridiales bacterium]
MKRGVKTAVFLALAVIIAAADQLTKHIIVKKIAFNEYVQVIKGFFKLVNCSNTGAAWGIFQDRTVYLAIVSGVAAVILIFLICCCRNNFLAVSLSLILGGAAGNLIDRIRLNYVVDFLYFKIFSYDFPVFNLGDSCVVIGCILFIVFILFIYKNGDKIFKFPFGKNSEAVKLDG